MKDQSSGKGGRTQIVQGPLQALLSRAPPGYSKANLGITHTESLFAGYLKRCKPCCSRTTESDSSSVFVTGSTNFKSELIRDHKKSNGHNRAVAAIKVAKNLHLAPLAWVLLTLSQDIAQKGEGLFDIAHFVAKRQMPFTSFPHICHLEMKHDIDLGSTYINGKPCENFVLSIATRLKNELSCKLQKCRFVSVMADSATDIGLCMKYKMFICATWLKEK